MFFASERQLGEHIFGVACPAPAAVSGDTNAIGLDPLMNRACGSPDDDGGFRRCQPLFCAHLGFEQTPKPSKPKRQA